MTLAFLKRVQRRVSLARGAPSSMLHDPEAYVRSAYLLLLRREIDRAALAEWRKIIKSGQFNQQRVIEGILDSREYLVRFGIDLTSIVHRARQAWIKTLPAFGRLLDIGGSNPMFPEGSLIHMGYPHRPRRLDIVDRPPEQQYFGKPAYDQSKPISFDWGEVRYFHAGAEGIGGVAELQDASFDGVFLGQAIEHVLPEAVPALLRWIRQHLAPGGRLVFDTPNRLLTRIQCPNSLIDPDHKYEYTPAEMIKLLQREGFRVEEVTGMVHLPLQAENGQFDPIEFEGSLQISDDTEGCYLMAFEATPDATETPPRTALKYGTTAGGEQ